MDKNLDNIFEVSKFAGMKAKGFESSMISELTGLTEEQIAAL